MTADELQTLIEEATADYALGDVALAVEKLNRATAEALGVHLPRLANRKSVV